jgi:ubiquinone/menaquinone biosynthesis C-methylase UbiE
MKIKHKLFHKPTEIFHAMSSSIFSQPTFTSKYERMTGNCTRLVAAEMVRIDSPPITSSSYILDNACGPGIVTEQVKLLHPQTRILAADLSPSMIEEVKQKTQSEGWNNVETDELDVRDLSKLADNTFTHVLTNMGTYIPNDPGSTVVAIKEMYRVLQVGGVAVTTAWAGMFSFSSVSKVDANNETRSCMALCVLRNCASDSTK